jgi:cysteine desulfurase
LIYLDHNATTPLAPEVLQTMMPFLEENFGNPSSVHTEGRKVRVKMDEAREHVASLIGAFPGEIIFTSGGTEANNMAILGTALSHKEKGNHIITCEIEHPAILNPCRQLEGLGFDIDFLPVDTKGRIDLNELQAKIRSSTILISIQHANSEVGTLQDIQSIGELAREKSILFHSDIVQSAGKIPLDIKSLPVDMASMSSHKLYGPKGVGALFMRKGLPALFSPICGGGQEKKRRGGTENVPGIAGFGKACELAKEHLKQGANLKIAETRDYLLNLIREKIQKIELYGDPDHRLPNTLNIGFPGADGESLLIGLDREGVSVSTGSACSSGSGLPSPVLMAMSIPEEKVNSSLRISLGNSSSEVEMQEVAHFLENLVKLSRGTSS